jgi:Fe-S cluster biogenesis protein NfuA
VSRGGDLRAAGERIEQLLGELGQLPDPRVRQRADELVRLLMELYGGCLERIVELTLAADGQSPDGADGQSPDAAGGQSPAGAGGQFPAGAGGEAPHGAPAGGAGTLLEQFAADDLVASLLILHGLHPLDTSARIERALASVRPFLASHGGDVELLGVDEAGRVRLRLAGSCHGCPSSRVTMQTAVERAIAERAPEVTAIEVDGVAEEPPPGGGPAPARVAPGPCLATGGDLDPAAAGAGALVQLGSGPA